MCKKVCLKKIYFQNKKIKLNVPNSAMFSAEIDPTLVTDRA